jgi:hypothetical protein
MAVAMNKRISLGAFALFIGVACTVPCLAQSAGRSAQAKQAEQAIADRLAAFVRTDRQVAAKLAAAGRTSGAGMAFAREYAPFLLHSGGVDGYLKSLQKCEAGDARPAASSTFCFRSWGHATRDRLGAVLADPVHQRTDRAGYDGHSMRLMQH